MQTCASCPQNALHGPLHLDHVRATFHLSGNLRLTPEEDTAAVEASGLYTITPTPNGLRVTLQIPSERYVAAVLSAEAAPDEQSASLASLAIVARTFALTNIRRHSDEDFDLCDSTHCQALRLGPLRSSIAQAVRETAGITLWNGSARASIYYTQNCGGISEAASALWPSERASYLSSHPDPYCLRRDPAVWQASIRLTDLSKIASEQHWNLPSPITGIRIAQHTASDRAKLLEISSPTRTVSLSASSLHFAINRALGWNQIRGDLYTVAIANDMLLFKGHGYGHGVGLCQVGAYQMALEHHTTAEILSFYYPGTHIGLTSSGGQWHTENIGAITLRTTVSDLHLNSAIQSAWQQALTLLPPAGNTPNPTITLAPTTELFRQLTASPGYLLAVTRRDQITLQPLSTLQRYGPLQPLLLHELLHALIESQSTAKAPLWLREGLTEALVDLHSAYKPPQSSIADIEQTLANPPNLATDQQAHRDAAAIVRTLGHTYSLTVMRQWLRDGVPPQVLATLH
jgi:stage II sporulation protein D